MHKTFSVLVALSCMVSGAVIAVETEEASFHDELFTVDTHVDIQRIDEAEGLNYLDLPDVQVDLVRMESGGLDAVFFILFSLQGELTPEGHAAAQEEALARHATIKRLLERHADRIELARSVDAARRIHESGKLVAFLGMENGYPLAGDPANLQQYFDLGVRYLGITHMGHNGLGDSSDPSFSKQEPATVHGGLSEAGREVVAEANRLGIMVDVSHAHRETTIQIAQASTMPVIASHSAMRGLTDIPRNMDDDQLMAVKESGGVVQVVAFNSHLKKESPQRLPAFIELFKELGFSSGMPDTENMEPEVREKYLEESARINEKWPKAVATVADFVDHIDYAVQLIGIDHVGIASDFGGGGGVQGWQHAGETPNVTQELVTRGYSHEDIEKLWGENLLRVMAEAEQQALRNNQTAN
jgi:membrane dipeptidase